MNLESKLTVKSAMITSGGTISAAIITALFTLFAANSNARSTAKSTAVTAVSNEVAVATDQVRVEIEQTATRLIQAHVEKLMVSSAGSVSERGRVEYVKGNPFTVSREAEGRFRVNFPIPFNNLAPIVVATPVGSSTVVHVLDIDTTGFSIQGHSLQHGQNIHTAFNFIVIEPETGKK